MLRLEEVLSTPTPTVLSVPTVTLTYDQRRRSRARVTLDDGREAALLLARGTILRDGDRLRGPDGTVVDVRAAPETLSLAHTLDEHLLARAAYHLGNRHVPLQIGPGWVAYEHDHVLDDMARALGLRVTTQQAPFEPEAGAFAHTHEHVHEHEHEHEHEHAHAHAHAHDHDKGGRHGR